MRTRIPRAVSGGATANGASINDIHRDAAAVARRVIEANNINYVRFTYVCNDGIIRSKVHYVGQAKKGLPLPSHVGLSVVEQLVTAVDDTVIDQSMFDPVEEVRLSPDWESFRPMRHCTGHARVFGPIVDGTGSPWNLCPRSFLQKAIGRATRAGLTLSIAFENEFYLLKDKGPALAPIDSSVYAQDDAFTRVADLMDAAAQSLVTAGAQPVTLHPESGPGQFEVAIAPSAPLKAADDQVIVRSTLKDLAAERGMLATFLPRPLGGSPSSGSHINVSVWKGGENITGDGAHLSAAGGSFVSGILNHLPALVAVTCPTVNSYLRLKPGMWSGAYCCWGRSNREAAIRVPYCKGGDVSHIEYRCADATCNPYLALGAIISAGMDGVERKLKLPTEAETDLTRIRPRALRPEGLTVLPHRLDLALESLANDAHLRDQMGQGLHSSFLAVRGAEYVRLRPGMTDRTVRMLARRF